MKKWLACSCLSIVVLGLVLAGGLAWFFLSSRGQLVQLQMACERGDADACVAAASARRTLGDPGRALELVGQACTLGADLACDEMAEATIFGDGLAQSPTASRAFLEQTCDSGALRKRLSAPLGLLGCRRLAQALGTGQGLARDTKRAAELFDTACGDGDALSCVGRAQLLEGPAADERHTQLQAMACHLAEAGGRLPLVLRVGSSGTTLNGIPLEDDALAERLAIILQARSGDRKTHVLWDRGLSPRNPLDLARISHACAIARSAGVDTVLLLGEFDEYTSAVKEACTAAGEPGGGLLPPPPPPPPPPPLRRRK